MLDGIPIQLRLWSRPFVVLAVLGAGVFLASKASQNRLLFPVALGGAYLLLRWPRLALPGLVVSALLVPFAIATGTESTVNAAVLMAAALVGLSVLQLLALHGNRMTGSRTFFPLLVFCVVAILAFIAGSQPWLVFAEDAPFRTQAAGLAIFLLSAGVYVAAGHQMREQKWLRLTMWLFLGLGALYILARLVPGQGGIVLGRFQQGAGGSVFWVWLVALAATQAAFNRSLRPAWRFGLGALTVATFYVAFSQDVTWTSGWLPALIGVMVALWVGSPRLGLIATLALAAFVAIDPQRAYNLVMNQNQYSLDTRLAAWTILGKIVETSPVLGLGPANYHWYTPLFPIMGYDVSFNSHNNYVDIIAQTGLLGFLCFLWFALTVFIIGLRLRGRVQAGFEQAYVSGAVGGLAGMLAAGMLGDWFLPFVYNIGLEGFRASILGWLFLGGLVALEQAARGRTLEEPEVS